MIFQDYDDEEEEDDEEGGRPKKKRRKGALGFIIDEAGKYLRFRFYLYHWHF